MEFHAKKLHSERRVSGRAKAVWGLAGAIALSGPAMASTSCSLDCPIDCANVKEYDITMREGERMETYSGSNKVIIEVLDIYQSARSENQITCRSYSGGARIRLTIESDPPYTREFNIVPNNCNAVQQSCVRINNTEVEQDMEFIPRVDAGTSDGGGSGGTGGDGGSSGGMDAGPPQMSADGWCRITNERVKFTLTLADGEIPVAPDAGSESSTGGSGTY
jgi:hypothetical protein